MFVLVLPSLARSCIAMKFGIAIAARMPMITTTIISSIRVKPFCDLVMVCNSSFCLVRDLVRFERGPDITERRQPMCHAIFRGGDSLRHFALRCAGDSHARAGRP